MLGELIVKINHIEGLTYCLNCVVQNIEYIPKDLQNSLLAIESISKEIKSKVIEIRNDVNKVV